MSEEKTIVLPERIQGLKVHPAAELLPTMTPEEFKALKEDIDVNNLRDPIILIHDEDGQALLLGWQGQVFLDRAKQAEPTPYSQGAARAALGNDLFRAWVKELAADGRNYRKQS